MKILKLANPASTIELVVSFPKVVLLLLVAAKTLGWTPAVAFQPEWLTEVAIQPKSDLTGMIRTHIPDLNSSSYQAFQSSVIEQWSTAIGAFADTPSSSEHRVLEIVLQEPNIRRTLVEYETELGQTVQAFLLENLANTTEVDRTLERTGDAPTKRPAVVVFHSTVENSLYQPVGLRGPDTQMPADPEQLNKAFALHLTRLGFVTLSPKNFLWPNAVGIQAQQQADQFHARQKASQDQSTKVSSARVHPTGMARMLLDCQRAVDVLGSLESVDKNRIGAVGHSLGAKEVLYLAAFDKRIKATVCSEGGLSISQSNWDADWYLGCACKKPEFNLNHHQLVACIAPRAFLLIGGESADGSASLPWLQEAAKAYQATSSLANLGFYNHRQGHQVTEQSLQRSIQWLKWHLK